MTNLNSDSSDGAHVGPDGGGGVLAPVVLVVQDAPPHRQAHPILTNSIIGDA